MTPVAVAALLDGTRADASAVRSGIGLAAFENLMSDTARALTCSPLADRYLLGHLTERGAGRSVLRAGLLLADHPAVNALEDAATRALCSMLGASWADFRPLSGLSATLCTMVALTEPGDLVYSIAAEHDGHFATQGLAARLGRQWAALPWDQVQDGPDVPALAAAWRRQPGAMLILDHSVPLRPLPVAALREAIGGDAVLVYDASHTLGLIAGGAFQDPLREGCDLIQANTHKSFPGAHKGLLAFADPATGRRSSAVIGETLLSSQATGPTLANFVTCLEMAEYGRAYAAAMLANAAALAGALTARGLTARPLAAAHSHLLIVDVAGGDAAALALGRALLDAGLRVNVRKARGRTALRLGVQEITRIGMSPCDMERLADLMAAAGRAADPVAWRPETAALAAEFSVVRYSFDPGADDGGADTSRQAAAAPAGQFADVS
ncbi:MAG TPA: hypothetical protein VGG25_00270 [Streptosporangiaceae bacterium]